MNIEDIKTVAVIGAGIMGTGIAQVFAQAGYTVFMRDVDYEITRRGFNSIKFSLQKLVEKGKLKTEEAQEVLSKVIPTLNLKEAVTHSDFIIEAVPENIELKKRVFKEIDQLCPKHAIIATNTSTLNVSEIANVTERPDKIVGMHFFNPAPIMKLVEIVQAHCTSLETINTVKELALKLGKTPVISKDSPGFIANRIAVLMLNEAIYALYEGVASAKEIDTALRLGYNHPMGPLELVDLIGLDTTLFIMETLYREFGDPKYRPCPLLRQMVRAGYLGRKSGKGFYDYRTQK
jgi:3-hydroxybutyryl-CoA dehydrogenase